MKKAFVLLIIITGLVACKKQNEKIDYTVHDQNYDLASSFIDKNIDSAFYYFNKMATISKDSFNIALAYNYIAGIQLDAGDYYGSQETYTLSLKFLNEQREKDHPIISSDNNGLGFSNLNLKRYSQAISYFDIGLKFNKDTSISLIIQKNIALSYQKLGNYNRAIEIYNEIIPKFTDNPTEYAKAISNLAKTIWLQDSKYNPVPEFLRALKIREQEKDAWGKNASFAHLADYYTYTKPDSALIYAHKMYAVARKLKSPDDQIEALQKLIKLSPLQQIKQYFEIYQKLDDSLQTARNSAKNQFALIRYETEKNKADNLKLQKDITEKKLWLFGISLFVIAGVIISAFWYKKRKLRLESEAQNSIRESQLRTSKKVHDVVANGLYRVMNEIENQDTLDRVNVLDKIEDLYEKSRDISYEEFQPAGQNFHKKIAGLLKSFATGNIEVSLIGNKADIWSTVSGTVRYEIEHVLLELMVNMTKHSQANEVLVKFEQKQHRVDIYYTDNGSGIGGSFQFKNGLTNTGNRIKSINGTINFDTNTKKGLKIHISFPVS